jgi:signal transduction histidine kinase
VQKLIDIFREGNLAGNRGEMTQSLDFMDQQLADRQKELESLKDRLIFDVSHELRTPVTNLNLYIELMEHGRPDKRMERDVILADEVIAPGALIPEGTPLFCVAL